MNISDITNCICIKGGTMNEKQFRKLQGYMADNNRKYDNGDEDEI